MTRIVAGEWKGHPLPNLKRGSVRPTTQRARTILFDTLFDIRGWQVLDLYSGTGALGFEALSRGAATVISIDGDRQYIQAQQSWSQKHALAERFRTICARIPAVLATLPDRFDLILADPPYDLEPATDLLERLEMLLKPDGVLVYERARTSSEPLEFPSLELIREKVVAETRFHFYKASQT